MDEHSEPGQPRVIWLHRTWIEYFAAVGAFVVAAALIALYTVSTNRAPLGDPLSIILFIVVMVTLPAVAGVYLVLRCVRCRFTVTPTALSYCDWRLRTTHIPWPGITGVFWYGWSYWFVGFSMRIEYLNTANRRRKLHAYPSSPSVVKKLRWLVHHTVSQAGLSEEEAPPTAFNLLLARTGRKQIIEQRWSRKSLASRR